MNLKKAKIIIQPIENLKVEWKRALKGEVKSIQKKGVILLPNAQTLGRILSASRLELFMAILRENPKSIYELAKLVQRDFKNVHSDLKLLADVGLIELRRSSGKRDAVKPVAMYCGLDLDLAA